MLTGTHIPLQEDDTAPPPNENKINIQVTKLKSSEYERNEESCQRAMLTNTGNRTGGSSGFEVMSVTLHGTGGTPGCYIL